MKEAEYTLRRLENNKHDRALLEEFDKKLSAFEKTLNERLIEGKHIIYNNIAHVFESGDCAAYVAEYNGEPIGYIVGKLKKSLPWFKNEKYGYIESMFVESTHRKKGIATMLFTSLKKWFLDNGIKTLELRTFSNNDRAIELYKKWGFNPHVTEMVCNIEE